MLIRCPECGFEREVDEGRLPPSAAIATCPKCRCKFRFRDPEATIPQAVTRDSHATSASPASQESHGATGPASASPEVVDATAAPSGMPAARDRGDTPAYPEQPVQTNTPDAPASAPAAASTSEDSGDDPLPPGAVIPGAPRHEAPEASPEVDRTDRAVPPYVQGRADDNASPASTKGKGDTKGDVWDAVSSVGDRWRKLYDTHMAQGAPPNQDDGTGQPREGIPWENLDRHGFFPGLYQTILRVMFGAPRFFTQIGSDGPSMRPVAFFILLGIFQSLMERLWYITTFNMLGPSIDDPQLHALLGGIAQEFGIGATLMLSPFTLILQLVCVTGAYHFMMRLVQPDKAHFGTMLRVVSYSAAPTVVSIVPLLGPTVGSLWFVACTVIGVKHAYRLPWSRVLLALGPLYILAIAVGVQMLKMVVAGGGA